MAGRCANPILASTGRVRTCSLRGQGFPPAIPDREQPAPRHRSGRDRRLPIFHGDDRGAPGRGKSNPPTTIRDRPVPVTSHPTRRVSGRPP